MRILIAIAAILIAATGITPFDLAGFHLGASRAGELTLTMGIMITLFLVTE